MGNDETINDSFDRVLFIAVKLDLIVKRVDSSIHAGASEASFANFLENSLIRAFASTNQR